MAQLKELFIQQLRSLLDTENRLVVALAKMSRAANNPKLREGIEKHLAQTEEHVDRLVQAFALLGETPDAKTSRGIIGLISEGEETMEEGRPKDEAIADLALIAAAQKVEHYEISAYGTARTLATQLGETKVAALLSLTLGEEEITDHLLTEIAKPLVQEATAAELSIAG
jgi:Mn-containing catalase